MFTNLGPGDLWIPPEPSEPTEYRSLQPLGDATVMVVAEVDCQVPLVTGIELDGGAFVPGDCFSASQIDLWQKAIESELDDDRRMAEWDAYGEAA